MKSALYRLQNDKNFGIFFRYLAETANYFVATAKSSHNDDRIRAVNLVIAEAFEKGLECGHAHGVHVGFERALIKDRGDHITVTDIFDAPKDPVYAPGGTGGSGYSVPFVSGSVPQASIKEEYYKEMPLREFGLGE